MLRKAMVESVACYGCEVLLLKREEQRKLIALESWLVCQDYEGGLKSSRIHVTIVFALG